METADVVIYILNFMELKDILAFLAVSSTIYQMIKESVYWRLISQRPDLLKGNVYTSSENVRLLSGDLSSLRENVRLLSGDLSSLEENVECIPQSSADVDCDLSYGGVGYLVPINIKEETIKEWLPWSD